MSEKTAAKDRESSSSTRGSDAEASDMEAIECFDAIDRFDPHPLWRGGVLQTFSIKAIQCELDPENDPRTTPLDVPDDQTPPDTLSGFLMRPDTPSPLPLVLLLHGMGGHALAGYMRSAAETLLAAGHPVVLWNNRGAGGSARNCRGLHHPGYTDDLQRLLVHLQEQHPRWSDRGVYALAFSLGANLLLRYLGEYGDDSKISAAVSVSAPIDMEQTSRQLRSGLNRIFDRYLLHRQREELLRDNADISDEERETIRNVRSVWDLDDSFTAPRFGFDSADEYYARNSAVHVLEGIRKPTVLIHSNDDPVVDPKVFDQFEFEPGGPLFPARINSGGHTGFYARDGSRWHEGAGVSFFRWVTKNR